VTATIRCGTLLLTAILGSLLAIPSSAFPQEGAVFRTPGEAAYCNDYSGELICWTPNDGFTVHMTARGRPPQVLPQKPPRLRR
jgi:hypothetical protein